MKIKIETPKHTPSQFPKLYKDKAGTIYLVFYCEETYYINILDYKGVGDFYHPCWNNTNLPKDFVEFPHNTFLTLIWE